MLLVELYIVSSIPYSIQDNYNEVGDACMHMGMLSALIDTTKKPLSYILGVLERLTKPDGSCKTAL